jgi:predicted anti-sigma-YlaC factor YlaD
MRTILFALLLCPPSFALTIATLEECGKIPDSLQVECRADVELGEEYLYAPPGSRPAPTLRKPVMRTRGDYLRRAGYLWLGSIGLSMGGLAVGMATDWSGGSQPLVYGLLGASWGLSVAVPIQLISAGKVNQ